MKHLLVLALLVVGCSQCSPTPSPKPPPEPEGTQAERCAEACARWRTNDCKDAEDVCTKFNDDTGECLETETCEQSCVREPDKYDTDAGCS